MAEWEILSDRPARGFQAPVQPASPQTGAGSWEILSDRPASSDPDVENKLLDRGRQLIQKEEADIDYSTGAPFSVRAQLQGAQNPTEAYKTLERTYGRGNFGQDRFDQWWVRQDVPSSKAGSLEQIAARHHGMPLETTSRRVAVLPKGLSGGLRNFFSGIVASPFATAGATLGAVGGEVVFPAGGGIPGAMAGAAAGKGLDQLTKWAMGTFAQKPAEVVGSMATEGSIAGVLQGAGPAVRTLKAPLQRALQRFSGVTPSSSMMARDLSAGGAVPPIGSYAPGATSLEYKRQLRDILSGPGGSAAEQKNILYLNSRMRSVLTNEGLAPPQVEQFMNEVGDTSARMSARTAGEAITSEAQRAHQGLVQTANTSRDEAERQLNHHTRVLESLSRAPASLGQSVADAIVTRRRQFGREMSDAYRAVDRMTGDTPIVPPVSIDQQARQIVSLLPPQAVPPIIRGLVGRNEPFTFEQAHALRTVFREHGEISDVAAQGITPHHYRLMAGAVDRAMQSAEGTTGQQAAQSLRRVDTLYREGIRRFNNRSINRVVQELRSGIVPEPGTVTRLFMTPDNVNLAREVLTMLPVDMRRRVVQADLNAMLHQAATWNDRSMMVVDGQSLIKLLDQRHRLLAATYPPDTLAELRLYATQLAAFDGRVDATALRDPTDITQLLREAVAARQAADIFVQQNPLGGLVSNSPMKVDAALAQITRPGREAVTEAAAHTLGERSPAWQTIRRHAMQKLFASSIIQRKSLDKTIAGEAIDRALRAFTPRQQELLFPGGLADDMRMLAKEARFLFPESASSDMGTSLAAASIKGGLWLNPLAVSKYITKQIAGWVADHPRILHLLADEVRVDPVRARSTMSVLQQFILAQGVRSGAPQGRGPDPSTQGQLVTPSSLVGRNIDRERAKDGGQEQRYGGPQ